MRSVMDNQAEKFQNDIKSVAVHLMIFQLYEPILYCRTDMPDLLSHIWCVREHMCTVLFGIHFHQYGAAQVQNPEKTLHYLYLIQIIEQSYFLANQIWIHPKWIIICLHHNRLENEPLGNFLRLPKNGQICLKPSWKSKEWGTKFCEIRKFCENTHACIESVTVILSCFSANQVLYGFVHYLHHIDNELHGMKKHLGKTSDRVTTIFAPSGFTPIKLSSPV